MGTRLAYTRQVSRPVTIKPPPPAPTDSPIATTKSQPPSAIAVKVEPTTSTPQPQKPGSSYPPYRSSNIDIDADPTYEPASKALMDLDIDAGTSYILMGLNNG